jgi:hypothetical protein
MANRSVSEESKVLSTMDKILKVGGARLRFDMLVTRLSKLGIFLGYDWLKATNPIIDWVTGELTWKLTKPDKKPQEGPEQI